MRVNVTPDQIQAAFDAVKAEGAFEESRGLWERGRPPTEMIQALCLRPEILRGFGAFGHGLYPDGLLERRIKELVIIAASEANDCQFCRDSHCHLVEITDIIPEPQRVIHEREAIAPRERLAIDYTRAAMANSNAIPDTLMGELREQFTDPELVELTLLIGYINMLNLFNNCLQVRYHGEYSLLGAGAP